MIHPMFRAEILILEVLCAGPNIEGFCQEACSADRYDDCVEKHCALLFLSFIHIVETSAIQSLTAH